MCLSSVTPPLIPAIPAAAAAAVGSRQHDAAAAASVVVVGNKLAAGTFGSAGYSVMWLLKLMLLTLLAGQRHSAGGCTATGGYRILPVRVAADDDAAGQSWLAPGWPGSLQNGTPATIITMHVQRVH